ncbi:hypothetical protein L484_019605 [Morus notabilis]|uniref:Uncharacterized protein n=1 Tax=Morus notabilis TaxID=981085 RepID=W9RVV8_9ROSA|nr:hypothetical protein L484_019605 [Morus notabilis]
MAGFDDVIGDSESISVTAGYVSVWRGGRSEGLWSGKAGGKQEGLEIRLVKQLKLNWLTCSYLYGIRKLGDQIEICPPVLPILYTGKTIL